MKKLKFMVEISTEFITDYAKSYEITDQLESLLSESVARLPYVRQTVVTPWDEVQS
jgi:hypothetical protein